MFTIAVLSNNPCRWFAKHLVRMGVALVLLAAWGLCAASSWSVEAPATDAAGQPSFVVIPAANRISERARQDFESKGITLKEQVEAQLQEDTLPLLQKRFQAAGLNDISLEKLPKGQIRVTLAANAGVETLERAKGLAGLQGRLSIQKVADVEELKATLAAIKADDVFGVRFSPIVKETAGCLWPFSIAPADADRGRTLMADINVNPKLLPEGRMLALSRAEAGEHTLYLVDNGPGLENITVQNAFSAPNKEQPNTFGVFLSLAEEDANRFGQFTEQNIGKHIAILVDGEVQCAPTVKARIADKSQISGNYTSHEAGKLAAALVSGAFPAPLVIVTKSESGNPSAPVAYKTPEGGYTKLVVFESAGDFKPQTPKELLDVFNGVCKVKTGYFRTEPRDGKLYGSVCTDDPDGVQKALSAEPRLKWTTAVPLTQKRFEDYSARKQ